MSSANDKGAWVDVGPLPQDPVMTADKLETNTIASDPATSLADDQHSTLLNNTQSLHDSLDIGKTLRLVSILQTTEDDDEYDCNLVECELVDFPLNQPPRFVYLESSLAFRHGDNHLRPILLSGRPCLISRGLEVCIRQLRKDQGPEGKRILFYILPICIDAETLASLRADTSRLLRHMERVQNAAIANIDALRVIGIMNVEEIKRARNLTLKIPDCQPGLELSYPQYVGDFRMFEYDSKAKALKAHNPLDRVANEIRLISVSSGEGDPDAPINLKLKCVSVLDEDTNFYALSYTWGSCDNQETVYVDGQAFSVHRNLFDFLKRYRTFEEKIGQSFYLWIDALSINQEDPDERSYEVLRMSEIYAAAERVQVWLDDYDSQQYAVYGTPMYSMRQIKERGEDLGPNSAHLMMREHLNQAPDLYRDFAQLVLRPYFLRAWCTQELAFAKEVLIMTENDITAGWHSMSSFSPTMTDLEAWLDLLKNEIHRDPYRYLLFGRGVHFSRFQLIHELQRRIVANELPTLLSLVLATFQLESSDPRDKLYSLWSLASDAEKLLTTPDYTRSTADIYTDFAMAWIREYDSLDILATGTVAQGGSETGPSSIPSWVPDWSGRHLMRPLISVFPSTAAHGCMLDDLEHASPYRAAAGSKPIFASVKYSEESQGLLVNGISCDVIDFVGDLALAFFAPPSSWERDLLSRFGEEGSTTLDVESPQVLDFYNALHAGRMVTGERAHEFLNATSLFHQASKAKDEEPKDSNLEKGYLAWRNFIMSTITGRRLVFTKRGHVGLAQAPVEIGDEVVILLGCSVPLILRHRDGLSGRWLVGDCFFRRMMDGAMVDEAGGMDFCDELPFAKIVRGLFKNVPPEGHRLETEPVDSSEDAEDNTDINDITRPQLLENGSPDVDNSQDPSDSQLLTDEFKKMAMASMQDVVTEAQKAPVFLEKPTPTTFLLL